MNIMKFGASFVLATALVLGGAAPLAHADDATAEKYLVTLEAPAQPAWTTNKEVFASSAQTLASKMKSSGIKVEKTFTSVGAISAEMTSAQAKALSGQPGVLGVEKNKNFVLSSGDGEWQENPPWHLDRMDELDYTRFDGLYRYLSSGYGVVVYVIDDGINPVKREGDDSLAFDLVGGKNFSGDGGSWEGCTELNHGTRVASVMGHTTYGVAKSADLFSLRVVPCAEGGTGEGTTEMFLEAIDWVLKNGVDPSVVHVSANFGTISTVVDSAVTRLYYSGFPVVVSAGNDATNACSSSPMRNPEMITVAATNRRDEQTSFSNYGRCVDLYAPGENIQVHEDTKFNSSGTSYASAMVAGAIAQYLATRWGSTPADIEQGIAKHSDVEVVRKISPSTPNVFLNATSMSQEDAPAKDYFADMEYDATKVVGTHAFVSGPWPQAGGSFATVWTEVYTPEGWRRSQVRPLDSEGGFRIPLTYGIAKLGTHVYRVGTASDSRTYYSRPFEFTRTPLKAMVTPRMKIYGPAYLQARVPTALNRNAYLQVENNWGYWQTIETVKASKTGYVKIPLTYMRHKPGTYKFRVVFSTKYGTITSEPGTLVRTLDW